MDKTPTAASWMSPRRDVELALSSLTVEDVSDASWALVESALEAIMGYGPKPDGQNMTPG